VRERSIGENFDANPVTGTGSMTVPTSPALEASNTILTED
jgi:hypothetical protein